MRGLLAGRVLRGAADQNAVPIDLQVCGDANLLGALRQLAREVRSHGARAAGGEPNVIDHAGPLPVCAQCFHVGRDRMHARLRCGVHAIRGKIFDFSVHQQPERAATISFAEIERERVRLGEALKLSEREVAEVVVRQQILQDVVAVLIECSCGRLGIATNYDFEFRIWRVRGKVFVRIDIFIRGMIDGEQAHLIEVDSFFEWLHEAEAQGRRWSLVAGRWRNFLFDHSAIDLYIFHRTGNVALVGADPVADDACAQHVGDELVALAIPDKQRGAGAAAAIDLEELLFFVAGDVDFVLQHAGRPQHADDVGFFRIAEADGQVGRVLAEVSVGAGDLKLLPVAAGEHFDFGSDGALVVGQSLERKAQPVILDCRLHCAAARQAHDSA